ncbi:hypothetical protein BD414DRAFT_492064 [Trametes punicea]|nr:hypothetical protein BD414DRAFT_492064 [Trametes punicea]
MERECSQAVLAAAASRRRCRRRRRHTPSRATSPHPLPLVLSLSFLYILNYPSLLKMPPRGSEGYDFTPILTHYLFLFTTILAVVSIPTISLLGHPLDAKACECR